MDRIFSPAGSQMLISIGLFFFASSPLAASSRCEASAGAASLTPSVLPPAVEAGRGDEAASSFRGPPGTGSFSQYWMDAPYGAVCPAVVPLGASAGRETARKREAGRGSE